MSRTLWYIYWDLFQLIMVQDKFSFGVTPKMREVTPGKHAVIKFTAEPKEVETDWGAKLSFPIILISHPDYESLSKDGLATVWETKSACGHQIWSALGIGTDGQHELGYDPRAAEKFKKVYFKSEWKLSRTEEGTYWVDEL